MVRRDIVLSKPVTFFEMAVLALINKIRVRVFRSHNISLGSITLSLDSIKPKFRYCNNRSQFSRILIQIYAFP